MAPISETVRTVHLDHDQMLILEDLRTGRLRVLHGGVWLTEPGETRDHFLQSGDALPVRSAGALVQAQGPTQVEVTRLGHRPPRRVRQPELEERILEVAGPPGEAVANTQVANDDVEREAGTAAHGSPIQGQPQLPIDAARRDVDAYHVGEPRPDGLVLCAHIGERQVRPGEAMRGQGPVLCGHVAWRGDPRHVAAATSGLLGIGVQAVSVRACEPGALMQATTVTVPARPSRP